MELSDLLVSYKLVKAPTRPVPSIPLIEEPITYYNETSTLEEPSKSSRLEEPKTTSYSISLPENIPGIKGSAEFEQAYDEVEKVNPEAKKYRAFLTKMALLESGFNKSILNRAGAPAYGYFQFMLDGKKYNNISTFAGTDIETFRNDPKLQILAAIKLAKSFENEFSDEDKRIAKLRGFTHFGLLGGAWLGGVGGVRTYLKGLGNPSDKHWSKEGKGTTIADRIRMFNFKLGGIIKALEGTIVSDNIRVVKPTIQTKFRKATPSERIKSILDIYGTQEQPQVSPDNRSKFERLYSYNKAQDSYNLYVESKRMEEGLNNLNGFLTFTDYATMGLGAGSLLTKGAKWVGKRAIGQISKLKIKKASADLHLVKIGDILKQDEVFPHNEYELPDYARPNSSPILAEEYHKIRLNRGFSDLPGVDNSGASGLNNIPYKRPNANIQYFDLNENLELYLELLYSFYKEKLPTALDEVIHDVIRKVTESNHAFAPAVRGKIFTNKKMLSNYFKPDQFPSIISHEIDHAIHIPTRPAEGFNTNLLIALDSTNTNYFIKNNNTELAARFSQIKDYFGLLNPKLEITEDMLKYAAEHYVKDTGLDNNMTDFFKSITDWKKAAKWGSEMATAYAGATILNNVQK